MKERVPSIVIGGPSAVAGNQKPEILKPRRTRRKKAKERMVFRQDLQDRQDFACGEVGNAV